jgi:hypothetical protein
MGDTVAIGGREWEDIGNELFQTMGGGVDRFDCELGRGGGAMEAELSGDGSG